jgi:putative membrane protein
MSFKTALIAAAFAAPFVLAAQAALVTPAFAVDKPVDFVTKAGEAGMYEIKTSKLALQRSKNPEIRHFAEHMIHDHEAAAAELKHVAAKDHIRVPTRLNSDLRGKYDDLARKGDDFDAKYVHLQVDAHNDAVNLFTDYSQNGEDARLKDFAAKTLPTLQGHQTDIKAIHDKMHLVP